MQALLHLIDDDTTLVTVNRRLARSVLERYAERRVASGASAWRTPDVIPWSAFVERSWRRCTGEGAVLLRPAQERLLWEQMVRRDPPPAEDEATPLSAAAAARRAQEAYALVNAWQLDLDAPEFGFSAESRAFRSWARAFRAHCAAARWTDAGSAAAALAKDGIPGATRRRCVFAGFDGLTPAQSAVRAALTGQGVDVADAPPPRRDGNVVHRVFDNPASELEAAATWARQLIRQGEAARIGVIVPELHHRRAQLERVFDEIMRPGAAMPGRAPVQRPFNLSYGDPLSRVGPVADALIALKLAAGRVELAEAGRLLRSPYLAGGDAALSARARMDARLRDTGEPEIGLDILLRRAANDTALRPALDGLVARHGASPARQPLQQWARFFSDWLAGLGWPGERVLDSREYQAFQAFGDLLDELAGMGAVAGAVAVDRAVSLLARLADEHLFQPRSGPVPVQVLGVLESAGLEFDALWVTGLHDGCWPPAPEPDPFVPVPLQRQAGLPTATPEGQLGLAGRRLDNWLRGADRVVLSHSRFDGDTPLRPSPVIAGAVFADAPAPGGIAAYSAALNASGAALEALTDEQAPRLAEFRLTRGGAGVIGDQAACPFRAFARWRLHAEAVPVAASPLDARIRGTLVHAVLRELWSGIGGHAALASLSEAELAGRVAAAVDRVLKTARRSRPHTLSGNLARVERGRLITLLGAWMRLEKNRAPFQVAAVERPMEAAAGPLALRIRPDRVDRLDDGGHLVIDYKTGGAEVSRWFGARPEEPQLAVYALAMEAGDAGTEVAGAAYARLKRGALGFLGLAARADLAPGVESLETTRLQAAAEVADWRALKAAWSEVIARLGNDFAAGDARVDPKDPPKTCAYCDVKPLCRVFEQGGGAASQGEP